MEKSEKKSSSQRDSTSLFVPASSSVSNSSGRNKVMLKPGRSLMDWIRFTHSAEDLSSTGGKVLEVSNRELAKHNSVHDAWIALRGKVYNITHYLEYHPGGEDELMRGAGKDATELFNQVHRWVNAESMLQKCFVGVLKNSWTIDVPKLPKITPLKTKHQKSTPNKENKPADQISCLGTSIGINENSGKLKEKPKNIVEMKSTWRILPTSKSYLTDLEIKVDIDSIKFMFTSSSIKQEGLITDLVGKEMYLKIENTVFLIIKFSVTYQENYEVEIEDGSSLELFLKQNPSIERDDVMLKFTVCDSPNQFVYWSCKLVKKIAVNYNTYLFTFMLPSGTKMWVPMGCHVMIRDNVEGTEIIRSYTPVPSCVFNTNFNDEQDGTKITLMIKIYPSGALTPVINRYNLGESLYISNYLGNFTESFMVNSDSLIMLAAGTGITPMVKIICYAITDKNIKRSLLLLFFNKTEEDILWRDELEEIKSTYSEFQVHHILSEPNMKWTGYTGQLNKDMLTQLLPKKDSLTNQKFLICGPIPFNLNALSYVEELGYSKDDIYAFSGS